MVQEAKPRPRLSFLDRLLLDEDDPTPSPPQREAGRLRAAVRRDLELLLNTRRWIRGWPMAAGELRRSVLAYGLPDVHTLPMATEGQRETFRLAIEEALHLFEPRFSSVSVSLLQNIEEFDRTLRFRIQAVLRVDADDEPVVYDSCLDPALRSFTVTDAADV